MSLHDVLEDPVELNLIEGAERALRLFTHDPRGDLVSEILLRERCWEPFESRLLLACLRPGAIAVDVGANLGYFSVLWCLAAVKVAKVFAFEPAADNYALLLKNLALNDCEPDVMAFRAGLGERNESATLYRSSSNLGDHQLEAGVSDRECEPVEVLAGADVLARHVSRIDLVKIDTQGTETAVVKGLLPLLAASTPRLQILVELTPFALRRAGSSGRELVTELASLGLPMAIVDHVEGRVVPHSPEALCRWSDNVDACAGDEGFMNILVGECPRGFST